MKEPVQDASPLVPANPTISSLRKAAATCEACPLWKSGTQTVFGEGPSKAQFVFVGEQPGDQEDLAGKPFVGPAGKILDRALEEAGIDRSLTYVTNAVKHFKWEPRGKRRIHKKPNTREIAACQPWLNAEISVLKPQVVIALGATAAQSLMGKDFRLTENRGKVIEAPFGKFAATFHPSSVLRGPPEDRERNFSELVADLKQILKRA
jgi:uracil-DNA glycosylase family protein